MSYDREPELQASKENSDLSRSKGTSNGAGLGSSRGAANGLSNSRGLRDVTKNEGDNTLRVGLGLGLGVVVRVG